VTVTSTPRHGARPWLLGAGGVLGGLVVTDWVSRAVIAVRFLLGDRGRMSPWVLIVSPVVHQLVLLTVSCLALGCVVAADGPRAVGLHTRPARQQLRVLGLYLAVPITLIAFSTIAVALLAAYWAPVTAAFTAGLTTPASSPWYSLFVGLTTAFCEEAIVVAIAYRLLEYLPGTAGRCLAHTGVGTAILVLVRLSYHAYYGLAVVVLVLWAWLTIRLYRHTRSLVPLIAGHALFYVLAFLEPGQHFAALLVIGVVLIAVTTHPTIGQAFGLDTHPRGKAT